MQVMNDVYSKFSQCQDNLPLAKNEVYVCTLWGQWFFLPAISGLRSKRCHTTVLSPVNVCMKGNIGAVSSACCCCGSSADGRSHSCWRSDNALFFCFLGHTLLLVQSFH